MRIGLLTDLAYKDMGRMGRCLAWCRSVQAEILVRTGSGLRQRMGFLAVRGYGLTVEWVGVRPFSSLESKGDGRTVAIARYEEALRRLISRSEKVYYFEARKHSQIALSARIASAFHRPFFAVEDGVRTAKELTLSLPGILS